MDIKPIETHYNGYRFRSRLEARWAVFFDAAGIKYEYEPEGFELKSGKKYLPDFWLPDFKIYVEIKPLLGFDDSCRKDIYNEQDKLCVDFRNEVGKAILLYRGAPWDDIWGMLYAFDVTDSSGGVSDYYNARFVDVGEPDNSVMVLMVNDCRLDRRICLDHSLQGENKRVVNGQMLIHQYPAYSAGAVLDAMTVPFDQRAYWLIDKAKLKAKQARFEYGESPMPDAYSHEIRHDNETQQVKHNTSRYIPGIPVKLPCRNYMLEMIGKATKGSWPFLLLVKLYVKKADMAVKDGLLKENPYDGIEYADLLDKEDTIKNSFYSQAINSKQTV